MIDTDALWVVRIVIGVFLGCSTLCSIVMIFVYNMTNEIMAKTIGETDQDNL